MKYENNKDHNTKSFSLHFLNITFFDTVVSDIWCLVPKQFSKVGWDRQKTPYKGTIQQ
jgi:hypothetical protein